MNPKKITASCSKTNTTLTELRKSLCKMKAAGSKGFEGLLRDLFERLLEQSIYLMKSGSQGGGDAYSGTFPDSLSIVWEDKRYQRKTVLPVDQLVSKLDQAARTYPEMDIWVVVTTREISAQHVSELQKKGSDEGVGVIIIDWPDQATRISSLASLCANYPDVLANHQIVLTNNEILNIKKHPQFATTLAILERQLKTPELSYFYHLNKCREYLKIAFCSQDEAFLRLGCYGNINTNTSHYICRDEVSQMLDNWWGNREQLYVFVHGQEGRGKTWSVLHWIDKNLATLPLTLVIPAQRLSPHELENEVAKALQATVSNSGNNLVYFKKKLGRYKNYRNKGIRLLIVIDGLNQNYSMAKFYESLLLQAASDEWTDGVKLMLTGRTSFFEKYSWFNKLYGENNNRVASVKVSDFNDAEQNALLTTHKLNVSDFEPAIQKLLKVPRYADLIIRHSKELKGIQECSIEHIFLLDWKDRGKRRNTSSPITEHDFLLIIRELAEHERSKSGIKLCELRSITSENLNVDEDALIPFIDELSQDSWLQPIGNKRLFTISPEWASTALALVLKDELASSKSFEDTYANFIEPMNGVDQISDLVLSAAMLSLLSVNPDEKIAKFLAEKFLRLQNHSQESVKRFYMLALIDFDFFMGLASDQIQNSRDHQILGFLKRTLLRACWKDKTNETEKKLRTKLNEWLGKVQPVNLVSTNGLFEKNIAEKMKLFDFKKFRASGYHWELKTGGKYGYTPHQFNLLSILGLDQSSKCGIVNWLIGYYFTPLRGTKEMEWLLRWNTKNDLISDLIGEISNLDALPAKAKSSILSSLADLSANPCMKDYVVTSKQTINTYRREVEIASRCQNPQQIILSEDAEYAEQKIKGFDWKNFDSSRSQNSDEFDYSYLKLYLARFNQKLLSEIEMKIYESKKEDSIDLRVFAFRRIEEAFLILNDNMLVQQDADLLLKDNTARNKIQWYQYTPLLCAKFSQLSFRAQINSILTFPQDLTLGSEIKSVMDLEGFDMEYFVEVLLTSKEEYQKVNLLYLGLVFDVEALNARLKSFLIDTCKCSCKTLRRLAIQWLLNWSDKGSWNEAVSHLKSSIHIKDTDESDILNILLRTTDENLEEIQVWCHPRYFPIVIKNRMYLDKDLTEFSDFLVQYIEAMLTNRKGLPGKQWSCRFCDQDDDKTFELIVDREPKILQLLMDFSESEHYFTAFDEFPFENLLKALWKTKPVQAQAIWLKLIVKLSESSSSLGSFSNIPFFVDNEYEAPLDYLFNKANTDLELLYFYYYSMKGNKEEKCTTLIKQAICFDTIAVKAKGLVLLGFASEVQESANLWNLPEVEKIDIGWLKDVKEHALIWYQKGKWAKSWYNKFINENTKSEEFAAYLLFQENFDLRTFLWLKTDWEKSLKDLDKAKKHFFLLQEKQREQKMKKQESELKSTLGFTKISNSLHPWCY